MNKKFPCVIKLAIGLGFLLGASPPALSEQFYEGKIIRLIVGFAPGGGYDAYTRVVARHLGKHIPGNPGSIVQNMVGSGGLVTAHYIFSRAKPDSLTVGVWNSGLVLSQALGDPSVEFRADKFGWIGAPSKGSPTCTVMGFTGLKTLEDILDSRKPIKMGGIVPGVMPSDLPKILNLTLGTKFHVIPGYRSSRNLPFALQRREVDGVCLSWESMRTIARALLDATGDDELVPFVTYGDSRDPEVKDLPQLTEVVKGKENLAILNTYLQQFNFQRPLTLPPGTPKERLGILRKAYKATLEDPQFLADAKRSNLAIDYVSGEEIEMFVGEILGISPETKEKLQFLLSEKEK